MKKILLLLILSVFIIGNVFSMIAPEYMLDAIKKSQIKTPAVIKSVKTIQNQQGNRIQEVTFEGLYDKQKYTAKCHNFKAFWPWDVPLVGVQSYNPKRGQKVFVTIDKNNGEITSMVIIDKKFEQKYKKAPDSVKYDCTGAYFEE